jgi:hypothetical protein
MPDKRPSDFRVQWDALQQEAAALAAEEKALRGLVPQTGKAEQQAARAAALAVDKDALVFAVWATTARDLADALLLAELAHDLFWPGVGAFPALPADLGDRDQREVAVAQLVLGVFTASQAIAEGGNS